MKQTELQFHPTSQTNCWRRKASYEWTYAIWFHLDKIQKLAKQNYTVYKFTFGDKIKN